VAKYHLTLLLLAASFLLSFAINAQSPGEIVLADPQRQYAVGPHMEILEDRDGLVITSFKPQALLLPPRIRSAHWPG
jgi:hypothetical protein